MFQFGEILTLAIAVVAAAYLVTNWRRVRSSPSLRPFAIPLILMIVTWTATVVEGMFPADATGPWIVMAQESVGIVGNETVPAALFNFVEHITTAIAAVLLFVAVWRLCRTPSETRG